MTQPQQEDLRKQILQILNENVNTFADMEGIGFSNDAFFEKYSTEAVNKLEALISTQRTQILNEVRWLVEGMKTEECFCDNCYSLTVIKGKPTRSEHCTNQGRDGIIDDLLQAIEKLKEEHAK